MKIESNVTNVADLAEMFRLPTWESIDENISCNSDTFHYANTQALADGKTESEAEEIAYQAEQDERYEVYHKWYDAVESVADTFFGYHGLKLIGKPHKNCLDSTRPFEFLINPVTNWKDAASKIMETINGVGYFHFSNVKEFADSVPCSVRSVVLTHLHWIKDYSEVYGETSPSRLFDMNMR